MRKLIVLLIALAVLAGACGGGGTDHNVLFVGNSYTHQNDVPKMVASITGANGVSIDYTMIAPGGATFEDHRISREVADAIRSGDYDIVVFQEQSQRPAVTVWFENQTVPAATDLAAFAEAHGARVIWFQTWGRRDGMPGLGFATFDEMQAALTDSYLQLAWDVGGQVAPAGQRWQRLRQQGHPIELHASDGSHATPAGSYAAALEIAGAITQAPIVHTPSVGGVDGSTAELLNS